MAYHISLFQNPSNNNVVTANPAAERDTYFIQAGGREEPGNDPLINKGNFGDYGTAFPTANWIYTGVYAYCFWDSGNSQIFGSTQQQPSTVQVLYSGSAGDLVLTVNTNGTITFTPT